MHLDYFVLLPPKNTLAGLRCTCMLSNFIEGLIEKSELDIYFSIFLFIETIFIDIIYVNELSHIRFIKKMSPKIWDQE